MNRLDKWAYLSDGEVAISVPVVPYRPMLPIPRFYPPAGTARKTSKKGMPQNSTLVGHTEMELGL